MSLKEEGGKSGGRGRQNEERIKTHKSSPLEAQPVCYLDGGARGVRTTGIEDQVSVSHVWLLHVVLADPVLIGKLQGVLDLAYWKDKERKVCYVGGRRK